MVSTISSTISGSISATSNNHCSNSSSNNNNTPHTILTIAPLPHTAATPLTASAGVGGNGACVNVTMKNSSKRDVIVRPIRCLIDGCARGAELTVAAPFKLPTHFSRMLRMTTMPKINIDDLLQVNRKHPHPNRWGCIVVLSFN